MLGLSYKAWETIIGLLLLWSTMAPMAWTAPEGCEWMELVACIVWPCIVLGIIEGYVRLQRKYGWGE
jgi:hypothetical protein